MMGRGTVRALMTLICCVLKRTAQKVAAYDGAGRS